MDLKGVFQSLFLCVILRNCLQAYEVEVKSFKPSKWTEARKLCVGSMTYINHTSEISEEIPNNVLRNLTEIFKGNVEIITGALNLEGCFRLTGLYESLMDNSEMFPDSSGEVAYCAMLCSNVSNRFAIQNRKCKCLDPLDVPRIEDVMLMDTSRCSECLDFDGYCGNMDAVTVYRSVPNLIMRDEDNLCYDDVNNSIPCFGWFQPKSGLCGDGKEVQSISWMSLNTRCAQNNKSYVSNKGEVLNTKHYKTFVMESTLPIEFDDQYQTNHIPIFGKFGHTAYNNESERYKIDYGNNDDLLTHSLCTLKLSQPEEYHAITIYGYLMLCAGGIGIAVISIASYLYMHRKPKRDYKKDKAVQKPEPKTRSLYGSIHVPPQA